MEEEDFVFLTLLSLTRYSIITQDIGIGIAGGVRSRFKQKSGLTATVNLKRNFTILLIYTPG